MIGQLNLLLALVACNPPLEINEGPAIKFQNPSNGSTINQGEPLTGEVRLIDRDGEGPMSVTVVSSIDGELGVFEGLLNNDIATFSLGVLQAGEHRWTATAVDDGGAQTERELVFTVNGAPTAPTLVVSPSSPTTIDELRGDIQAEGTDPEGGPLIHSWRWENLTGGASFDGIEFPASIDSSFTLRDEQWRFLVTTYEAIETDNGLAVLTGGARTDAFLDVTIANSPPTALAGLSIAPSTPRPFDDLVCSYAVAATDSDGDPLTDVWTWETLQGATWTTIGSASRLPADLTQGGSTYRCTAAASDGSDTSPSVSTEVTVSDATATASVANVHVSGSAQDRFLGEYAAGVSIDASPSSDLLLALPEASDFAAGGGWVAVFDGPPASGSDESDAPRSIGGVPNAGFGAPLQPIPDATGDQRPDLLIGAAGDAGVVDPFVLLVPGDSHSATHIDSDEPGWGFVTLLHADSANAHGFGISVAAGDIDNSGVSEVFISQSRDGEKNKVFVFDDQELNPDTSVTTSSATAITAGDKDDDFGDVMISGGDLTGDGVDDLIVANPTQDDGKAIYVYSGNQLTGGDLSAGSATTRIATDGDYGAGESFALGDLNGDGVDDLIVGAPRYGVGGAAFIFLGGSLQEHPILTTLMSLCLETHPATTLVHVYRCSRTRVLTGAMSY